MFKRGYMTDYPVVLVGRQVLHTPSSCCRSIYLCQPHFSNPATVILLSIQDTRPKTNHALRRTPRPSAAFRSPGDTRLCSGPRPRRMLGRRRLLFPMACHCVLPLRLPADTDVALVASVSVPGPRPPRLPGSATHRGKYAYQRPGRQHKSRLRRVVRIGRAAGNSPTRPRRLYRAMLRTLNE